MATVRQVLSEKGNDVWSISPQDTILDALHLMAQKEVGALLVLDQGRLVGIFSERDFARRASQSETLNLTRKVADLMTTTVYYVTEKETIEDCMALMTQHRIRHLPVLEGKQLKGVISIGDVVKEMISDRDSMIRGLENYITGRDYVS